MTVLQTETRDTVCWLWLNRPERLNALNQELLEELHETVLKLAEDSSIRAIVLAGRGKAFSAGFDIRWMVERTPDVVRTDRAHLRAIFDAIERTPQPIISAVQGDAMGGGLILTMVSDLVLATEQARFGAPEVKIGLFPSLGLIPRLERLVGLRAAKQLVMTGEPITALTAQQIGLVNTIYADNDTLYEEAQQLATRLAGLPHKALRGIKTAFEKHSLPDYTAWETDTSVECWAEPERLAAMLAFLDKKQPRSE